MTICDVDFVQLIYSYNNRIEPSYWIDMSRVPICSDSYFYDVMFY